jgi:hypothetical protein
VRLPDNGTAPPGPHYLEFSIFARAAPSGARRIAGNYRGGAVAWATMREENAGEAKHAGAGRYAETGWRASLGVPPSCPSRYFNDKRRRRGRKNDAGPVDW